MKNVLNEKKSILTARTGDCVNYEEKGWEMKEQAHFGKLNICKIRNRKVFFTKRYSKQYNSRDV